MIITTSEFSVLQQKARMRLLRLHYEAQCGHLGGNLSCIDILLYLHFYVMKFGAPNPYDDDIFILSKGHSAGAYYVTLWAMGLMSEEELSTFHKDSGLCGHITAAHSMFGTGSLGHGLSLAVGVAKARQLSGAKGRVFCLLSDGETEEGSTQEALRFSQFFDNLVVVVDGNGLKGFGECVAWEKFRHFNGHNLCGLQNAFNHRRIFFETVKGFGTCYAEKMESHYLPLNEQQYKEACAAIIFEDVAA